MAEPNVRNTRGVRNGESIAADTQAPAVRPPYVTQEEVLGWRPLARNPIKAGKSLDEFVALLNAHIQFYAHVKQARQHGPALPRPGAVIDSAYALRSDLDKLQMLDDPFWIGLGAPPGGMVKLQSALAELGAFLLARPQKKCGRKREDWHAYAAEYAEAIAAVLREAGARSPSRTNAAGPVAAIGAAAITRVLGRSCTAAAFAAAVRSELRRPARYEELML